MKARKSITSKKPARPAVEPGETKASHSPGKPRRPRRIRSVRQFVDAVLKEDEFVAAMRDLLKAEDLKVKQHAVDKMIELHFGKSATAAPGDPSNGSLRVIFDMPRPAREDIVRKKTAREREGN